MEDDFSDWLITVRRRLHEYPELSGNEFKTQAIIMQELDRLHINNQKIAGTGIIGTITGRNKGKTIALRADMDALKIQEEVTALNTSYISRHKGVMHACGHDGHMAMVLGAARLLQKGQKQMKGNVRFIFQPAEEVPPGGALRVIKEGGLDGVDAILGLHLFPNYKSGEIFLKEGVMMASSCKFEISMTGKPGHHFNADACIDPITISSEFISTIRETITCALPESTPFVFETGTIHGGEQYNQIPGKVNISGSFRALDPDHLQMIEQTQRQTLDHLMQKYKKEKQSNLPKYEFKVITGYPVLINDPVFTKAAVSVLKKNFKQVTENTTPVFTSEDFAYYLREKPGTFLFLGTRNPQKKLVHELHSDRFDIDEPVLETGACLLYTLVHDFLENPSEYLSNQ
jgi:amidohydrolase